MSIAKEQKRVKKEGDFYASRPKCFRIWMILSGGVVYILGRPLFEFCATGGFGKDRQLCLFPPSCQVRPAFFRELGREPLPDKRGEFIRADIRLLRFF